MKSYVTNAKRRHGFTLLETLVSIGVVATVGALIAQVFFTTTRTNTKTELLKDVKQNGEYAVDLMTRLIHNSLQVAPADCSPTGSTQQYIDIENPDGNTTQFGCLDYDDHVNPAVSRIASVSAMTGSTDYLTSSNVTLGGTSCADPTNSLQFTCTSYADQAPVVTIQFKLGQRGTSTSNFEQANINFKTSVSSRN